MTKTTDDWTEPEPGDPDGPIDNWSTRLALGCKHEDLQGWEFKTTWAPEGVPFDPDLPPEGAGWVRNTYKAGGFEIRTTRNGSGVRQQLSYWRRKLT
jgi:hypothetical protein